MADMKAVNGGSDVGVPGISHIPPPTNPLVTALLTDMYQLTMAYAYWKGGKHNDNAVFDLLFRKNPFGGEYTVFAGLEECIRFAANFRFAPTDIAYLRTVLPECCEDAFFVFLSSVDCSQVAIWALPEASVCFPRVPIVRVEGPLLVAQLLETTFLTLVNYASLVTTNAARHRHVAGPTKTLLEYGLRRAQGPDGGISASKYTYIGGFDGTSNLEAGRLFGIPVRGTHSHAYVTSFMGLEDVRTRQLESADGARVCEDFVALTQQWMMKMRVLRSGVPNFCAVALSLRELGYAPLGVRLDSGDLAYLSQKTRQVLAAVGLEGCKIAASNDINEETLDSLNKQGHDIDAFGIGTHLVTCYRQPALGCVYKLVSINGHPRIKLSEEMEKVTIPGKKRSFRLYGREGFALVDLLVGAKEAPPRVGERILCRHPFSESLRAHVVPQRVEELLTCYWKGPTDAAEERLPSLEELKQRCSEQLAAMRGDHVRSLNPTPYKVSVSDQLYKYIHELWLKEAPVGELN